MSHRITVVLISILSVCGVAALASGCGDDTGASQGGAGTEGSGSSATAGSSGSGATVGSASSGAGGGGGAGGAGGAGGGVACYGDSAAWTAVTAEPVTCSKNSDCCVVVNSCLNAAHVFTAANTGKASASWPYCDNQCTDCIPPAVKVECSSEKKCVGYKVPLSDNPPPELSQDHCGVDEPPIMMMNPGLAFTCGG
jgi:hypothetical protein